MYDKEYVCTCAITFSRFPHGHTQNIYFPISETQWISTRVIRSKIMLNWNRKSLTLCLSKPSAYVQGNNISESTFILGNYAIWVCKRFADENGVHVQWTYIKYPPGSPRKYSSRSPIALKEAKNMIKKY